MVQTVTRSRDFGHAACMMASGLVKAALCSIVTDSTFTGLSERRKVAMQQAESLIEISRDTTHLTNFDDFAADLISTLETTGAKDVLAPLSWRDRGFGQNFIQ